MREVITIASILGCGVENILPRAPQVDVSGGGDGCAGTGAGGERCGGRGSKDTGDGFKMGDNGGVDFAGGDCELCGVEEGVSGRSYSQ